MPKSRNINQPRFKWSPWHDAIIAATYEHTSNHALVKVIGCTHGQLYSRAQKYKLKKSRWFWNTHPTSGHVMQMPEYKRSVGRFTKGHVPHNKGRKGFCFKGSEKGWFSTGTRPKNWLPIGHMRKMAREGYYEVKISATGYKPTDWVPVQRLVWERCTGKPVPKGCVVYYLDGNYENYEITNLGCITKAQNMMRNSMHQYGIDYVRIKQLQGQLTRQFNIKEKQNEQCTNAV